MNLIIYLLNYQNLYNNCFFFSNIKLYFDYYNKDHSTHYDLVILYYNSPLILFIHKLEYIAFSYDVFAIIISSTF